MAIIDSQQQRLAPRDAMNATMASAPINVHGKEKVALEFDHHYKQGKAGQAAEVRVGFDGGEPEVVAKYGSDRLTSHEYIAVSYTHLTLPTNREV